MLTFEILFTFMFGISDCSPMSVFL